MSGRLSPQQIVRDPNWLAHRYDPSADMFHFIPVARTIQRQVTFLTDDYLPKGLEVRPVGREEAVSAIANIAPVHFIFHSAFCCSTLLARAFDLPGKAMGLKEPVLFNDISGMLLRGAERATIARALDHAMLMLSRPFEPGETQIIKPSNIINGLAGAMMALRPDARALFLHAPLETFLKSVAKKEMWGRLWVRDLYVKQLKTGLIDLAFEHDQYLQLTDIQVAAVTWLAQHAHFAKLAAQLGRKRLLALDSETLLAHPAKVLAELAAHFQIPLTEGEIAEITAGPAFAEHSKTGERFGGPAREAEYRDVARIHADEIEKVSVWARELAKSAGVSLAMSNPLVG